VSKNAIKTLKRKPLMTRPVNLCHDIPPKEHNNKTTVNVSIN